MLLLSQNNATAATGSRRIALPSLVRMQQPQHAAVIDSSNRFGASVISAVLPAAGGYDLAVNNLFPIPNAGAAVKANKFAFVSGSAGIPYGIDTGASIFRRSTFTKLFQIQVNSIASGHIFSTDSRVNVGIGVETIAAGQLGVSIYDGAFKQISFVPTTGILYTLVIVATESLLSFYANGTLIGSVAISPIIFQAGRATNYGFNTVSNANSMLFDMYCSLMLSSAYLANDIAALSANPWQVFR